jgi:hypothetical protein
MKNSMRFDVQIVNELQNIRGIGHFGIIMTMPVF